MLFFPSFYVIIRAACLIGGIILLVGGLRALPAVKRESYDRESLKVNISAAVIMIVVGSLLIFFGSAWIVRSLGSALGWF